MDHESNVTTVCCYDNNSLIHVMLIFEKKTTTTFSKNWYEIYKKKKKQCTGKDSQLTQSKDGKQQSHGASHLCHDVGYGTASSSPNPEII